MLVSRNDIISQLRLTLTQKLNSYKNELHDLEDGIKNETKSSAGDKYETSRSLSQIEIGLQKNNIQKTETDLHGLNEIEKTQTSTKQITLGSFFNTTQGFFFLAISYGKLKVNEIEINVISTSSPIGKLFLNKNKGEKISLNGNEITILEIF